MIVAQDERKKREDERQRQQSALESLRTDVKEREQDAVNRQRQYDEVWRQFF